MRTPALLRHRWEPLTAAAILGLATFLRVAWPRLTEFKFSEARLMALALELTQKGRLPLVGVPSSAGFDHSPVSVYLYLPPFFVSSSPISATIYGGLVGVAAVWLCWTLSKRWPGGGRWAAVVSSLLLAVSPWAVSYSRKIWQVTFVPALALLAVGFAISALVGPKRWYLAPAIVALAVLVQVHPSAVWLAAAFGLWLIVFRKKVSWAPLLVGGGLGALTAVPFLLHQLQNGWPAWKALQSLPNSGWTLSSLSLTWEVLTGRGIHVLAGEASADLASAMRWGAAFDVLGWLTLVATLGLIVRAIRHWRSQDLEQWEAARVDFVLVTWLIIPVVMNLKPSLPLHLHFFTLVLPAAFLLIGRAGEGLGRALAAGRAERIFRGGSLLVFSGLAVAQVVALVMVARFVATHDIVGGFGTPLGQYMDVADQALEQAHRNGAVEILVVAQHDSIVVDPIPAIFDVLLRGRTSYRFVDGNSTAVFPQHTAMALVAPQAGRAVEWYLAGRPAQELAHGYRAVALDGASVPKELLSIDGPRLFETGLEVQGYVWDSAPSPGKTATLWLLWQVLWSNPEDTHFFIQLVGVDGEVIAQSDASGYPLEYRRKGDRVLTKIDITLPLDAPPPPYELRLGAYLFPQVENVPVIDSSGRWAADCVLINP